jgi:hypothetical protein
MIGWTGKASLKCMTAPPAADGNIPPFNKTGHPLRKAFQSFAETGRKYDLRKVGRRNQNVGYPQSILESVGRRFALQP